MEISKEQFLMAASKLGLSEENTKALWEALEAEELKNTSMPKLLYYFGALIVISALTWFMTLGWEAFGGGGIFVISALYAVTFFLAGAKLWNKEGLKIPAGLLITMGVSVTPLAIYGIETYFGIFSNGSTDNYTSFYSVIEGRWIWMEIGTIVAGLVALRFYPFPFLTAPIFFAAWFLSMDIMPLLVGREGSFDEKALISLAFGLFFLLIAYVMDLKKMPQYGFWGYLFGTITFWGSLTALCIDKGELVFFLYLLINLSMMVKSILIKRKVFMIFGAIGTFFYLSHLAYDLFRDSLLFPFVLTFLGLSVIYLGVLYQKNSEWIEKKIFGLLPKWLRDMLP